MSQTSRRNFLKSTARSNGMVNLAKYCILFLTAASADAALGPNLLVDGMVAMEVPARPLIELGATHIVSVHLPSDERESLDPLSLVAVVNRCFQLMSSRMESEWRRYSDAVITPRVPSDVGWDSFDNVRSTIRAGEVAANLVIPQIRMWFPPAVTAAAQQ